MHVRWYLDVQWMYTSTTIVLGIYTIINMDFLNLLDPVDIPGHRVLSG